MLRIGVPSPALRAFHRALRAPLLAALLTMGAGCGSGEPPLAPAAALETLGVAESEARRQTIDVLVSGNPYGLIATAGRAFKALSDDQRRSVITSLAAWTRSYVDSDQFAEVYAGYREQSRPVAEVFDESVDDAVARWAEEGRAQVQEMRTAVLPMLPEAERPQMSKDLEAMAAQFDDPQFTALQRQAIEMERTSARERYQEDLARWEQDFPADPRRLVAERLQEFLDTCADVDFGARLEERWGLLRFVDETYERKPDVWKLCYRAGEESVSTAREAARDWLDDLG